ncbi:hypothetical protein DH2020_033334 [Rehmannia glutinosa]|uniref:Senescence regulator S40 n=1 Tax=Rehmannia glutinosa TaxID=99300 RepID=A0ABR0VCN7_REHGL
MEKRYGGLYTHGTSVWTSNRNEEFQEEDIWGVFQERKKDIPDSRAINSFKEPSFISKPGPTGTRMIPKSNKSRVSQDSKTVHHSAPVNVPHWSKIYGTTSRNVANSKHAYSWLDEEEEDGDDDEDGIIIPPHELIARKQTFSFSVCEGAGRTLKGRDLSRVRNAVLTKTGFLESTLSNYY